MIVKNTKLDLETRFILYQIDENYRNANPEIRKEIDLSRLSWKNALRIASKNRVIYLFSKRVMEDQDFCQRNRPPKILKQIVRAGEEELDRLSKTLQFVTYTLGGRIPFLLVKTEQYIPSVTHDVDILVKDESDFDDAIEIMEDEGAIFKLDETYKGACYKEGLLRIELHQRLTWGGMFFLDEDFLWNKPKHIKLGERTFLIPKREANATLHLAHTIFDCQYLTLRDFILITSLCRHLNWKEVLSTADKYGWRNSLASSLLLLAELYYNVYSQELPIPFDSPRPSISPKFPYWYSPSQVIAAFKEKIRKDLENGRKVNLNKIILYLIFYGYKRLRYRLPSRLYFVHSWLY